MDVLEIFVAATFDAGGDGFGCAFNGDQAILFVPGIDPVAVVRDRLINDRSHRQ